MGRGFLTFCLFFPAAIGFAASAAAQNGCPAGETFVLPLNRCIAMGEGARCPPGMRFDPHEKRCFGTPPHDERCPPGQNSAQPQGNCVPAPPPDRPPSAHPAPVVREGQPRA